MARIGIRRLFLWATLCTAVIWLFLAGPGQMARKSRILKEIGMQSSSRAITGEQILFQKIPQCSCERLLFYPPPYDKPHKIFNTTSTCSDEGTFYQSGQRVVTFTLYYTARKSKAREKLYQDGIQLNLNRIRELYPGHSMRIYTDVKLAGDYCNFVCNNSDLLWCDIRNTPKFGNLSDMFFPNWRFLTLGDPTVEYFLSRDLDSIITEREAAVFFDWLHVGKPIHLMRDKQKAHNIPILAGMWGARNNLLGEDVSEELRGKIIDMSKTMRRYKGQDQSILTKVIFNPMKSDIVAYDSYHCKRWAKSTLVRPFPTQRKDNQSDFVGNYDLGRKKYDELPICPEECRPSYGKDWERC